MKLGLIAMSGVRACDEELTRLGLTLPGFVQRTRVIASLPSLSLLTLAGLTPPDVDVSYLDVPDLARVDHLPGTFDAVAIASYSARIKEAYALADRYRQEGTRVILGGLHVTACPDEAAGHADAIVIGEAEPVWPEVVADLKRDALQPRYATRPGTFDLADAPMPRFDLLDMDQYNRITVQTQRGCPFACEFCAASIRISPRFKFKPVAKVINEIQRIKDRWANPFIEFADDNTFANKSHGKRLVRAIIPEGIRWFTETDVSVADDDELLSMLRDSGCAQILIGLESPRPEAVNGVETKCNWKARQVDRYLEAVQSIQRHGISVNGCFVLGLDGTGPESFAQVSDFVEQSGLHEVQITVQTAFPGTPLYDRLLAEGRLLRPRAWETCTLFDVNFQPDRMSVAELESGFRELMTELYSDEATRRRRSAFRHAKSGREWPRC